MAKLKRVRVIDLKTEYGHELKRLEFLECEYKGFENLSPIGYFQFQKFDNGFYQFTNLEINTDKIFDMVTMTKYLKELKENCLHDDNFKTVFNVLNCSEYKLHKNMFVSVLDDGKNLYSIIDDEKNELYSRFVASNEITAVKKANKLYSRSYSLKSELIELT